MTSPYSSIRAWLASLDRLDALQPVLVVPSHGDTGEASTIDGYRRF